MNDLQLRMARVALKLSVRGMADLTEVSHFTIVRMEGGHAVKPATVAKVRAALEAAGIVFIEANGGGPGVRLRDPEK